MIVDILSIIAGLALLIFGGDYLVRGAVALALKLGITPAIVGLTVLAMGTSAPELIVSVSAAIGGSPDIALGSVVGSNIANVLLILGATAVISPVLSDDEELKLSWGYAVAASVLLIVLCFIGPLVWWDGVILLGALAAVLYAQIRRARTGHSHEPELHAGSDGGHRIAILIGIGLIALPIGAQLLVSGASDIARAFGISETVIGLTLVAVGTSLPELSASVASALRGRADMALGNVIGSNLFNILAILGVTSFFGPIHIEPALLHFDLWLMLAAMLIVGPFLLRHIAIGRGMGIALVASYAAYTLWLLAA